MQETYPLTVAGIKRTLQICRVSEKVSIAAFNMLGDVELTEACARELIKKAPAHDIIITAEAKGIPLAQEMARQLGEKRYLVARKSAKLYMKNPVSVEVKSITTTKKQVLYIDADDVKYMKDFRVLIVDDVISTGESLRAIETLVTTAGGNIVGCLSVLAEGDATQREDIKFLEPLPLFCD